MKPSLSDVIKGERRRSARVTPDPLLTICLPSGNHGIVLDVSHEGVGFLASSPVEETATIRFEICARAPQGPAGSGQLMWKDDSGKRGGLRFAEVSEELRNLIAQFVPAKTEEASKASPKKLSRAHAGLPKRSETDSESNRRILGSDDIPDMPHFGRKAAAAAAYPVDTRERTFYANAVTIGMACVISASIWYGLYSSKGRSEALNLYSRLRQPVLAFTSAQMDRLKNGWTPQASSGESGEIPSLPQPPKTAAAAPANLPSPVQATPSLAEAAPSLAQAALKTDPNPAPATAVLAPVAEKKDTRLDGPLLSPPTSQALQPSRSEIAVRTKETDQDRDPSPTPLVAAEKLLRDDSDASNAPKAAQLLWQQVEKGNSGAAIDLADLYLTGRGVEKSCNQALVLLTAAKNHKNALAESKLRSLDQYGCGGGAGLTPTEQQNASSSDSDSVNR